MPRMRKTIPVVNSLKLFLINAIFIYLPFLQRCRCTISIPHNANVVNTPP